MAISSPQTGAGALLREWRNRRRRTQLDLGFPDAATAEALRKLPRR
jgi:hypothetical protein